MLSKSGAKTFFIGGTALCTVAFLLLTMDTVRQLDDRSHFDAFTPEAKVGYDIYIDNNCMGCHTLLGEGAYYAPELTQVVSRRGADWIRIFLKNPAGLYPGRRKMVKYDFFDPALDPNAEANISAMIEFFSWVEGIDTNGFPPAPDLRVAGSTSTSATQATAKAPASLTVCLGCHAIQGKGGTIGPSFDGVEQRYNAETLRVWLKDPQSVKPGTTMPNLGLSDETIDELVGFLLKGGG